MTGGYCETKRAENGRAVGGGCTSFVEVFYDSDGGEGGGGVVESHFPRKQRLLERGCDR